MSLSCYNKIIRSQNLEPIGSIFCDMIICYNMTNKWLQNCATLEKVDAKSWTLVQYFAWRYHQILNRSVQYFVIGSLFAIIKNVGQNQVPTSRHKHVRNSHFCNQKSTFFDSLQNMVFEGFDMSSDMFGHVGRRMNFILCHNPVWRRQPLHRIGHNVGSLAKPML